MNKEIIPATWMISIILFVAIFIFPLMIIEEYGLRWGALLSWIFSLVFTCFLMSGINDIIEGEKPNVEGSQ